MQSESTAPLLDLLCASADAARPMPPALVVMAHPDDEVVSLGSRLLRLREATLVHVTDGAPRDGVDARKHGFAGPEEYARARREELEQAVALAGIEPSQLLELGCPDQQASLRMAEIARKISELIEKIRPEWIVTLPYEGGHPDHDATAFGVHAGCRVLEARGARSPAIVEATGYHVGPMGIEVYRFLPAAGHEPVTVVLSEQERQLKRKMLECFASQQETLAYFPVELERFRAAPQYDFTRPPHEGTLYYEMYPWGMTGKRFCELGAGALEKLGIRGAI